MYLVLCLGFLKYAYVAMMVVDDDCDDLDDVVDDLDDVSDDVGDDLDDDLDDVDDDDNNEWC